MNVWPISTNKERKRKCLALMSVQYVAGADTIAFPVIAAVELATVSILTPTETGCASIAISAMAEAR